MTKTYLLKRNLALLLVLSCLLGSSVVQGMDTKVSSDRDIDKLFKAYIQEKSNNQSSTTCEKNPLLRLKLHNEGAITKKFDGFVKQLAWIQSKFADKKRFIEKYFSGLILDLANTEVYVNDFKKLVRLDNLFSLNLCRCYIITDENDPDATYPEDELECDKRAANEIIAIKDCENLKELDLSSLDKDVELNTLEQIFRSKKLQKSVRSLKLKVYDGKSRRASVRALIPLVNKFKNLEYLNLSRSNIKSDDLDKLDLKNLRVLILKRCNLDSLEFVKKFEKLQKIVLTGSRLKEKMLRSINTEGVKNHLKELVVDDIEEYSNSTMISIVSAWNQRKG